MNEQKKSCADIEYSISISGSFNGTKEEFERAINNLISKLVKDDKRFSPVIVDEIETFTD